VGRALPPPPPPPTPQTPIPNPHDKIILLKLNKFIF